MNERVYIGPTKRRKMTRDRAAGIYIARNGICGECGVQIRDGEAYDIDHPDALCLGGSDDDADLWPIHVRCHRQDKTPRDRKAKAKRDKIITAGWTGRRKRGGFRGWTRMDGTPVWKDQR